MQFSLKQTIMKSPNLNVIHLAFMLLFILFISKNINAQKTEIDHHKICLNCPPSGIDQSAIFQAIASDKRIIILLVADTTAIVNPAEALMTPRTFV